MPEGKKRLNNTKALSSVPYKGNPLAYSMPVTSCDKDRERAFSAMCGIEPPPVKKTGPGKANFSSAFTQLKD